MRDTASAIEGGFISTTLAGRYGERVNVVDVIADLAKATRTVADVIKPIAAAPADDASGASVDSLTEAVMGITSGLYAIASSINDLAEVMREGQR